MSQIALDNSYLPNALQKIRHANTPPELRTQIRKLKSPVPSDSVTLSHNIKPQELKLHQEVPKVSDLPLAIELKEGSLFHAIATLSKQLSGLAKAAHKEVQATGGMANG